MKLQTKILAGYLTSSLLILGMGAAILFTINTVNPVVDELHREVTALGRAVSLSGLSGRIVSLRTELSHTVYQFVLSQDIGYEHRYERTFRELSEVFEQAINESESEEDATIFRNLQETSLKLGTSEREMINLVKAKKIEQAEALAQSEDYVELNTSILDFIATLANRKQADSRDVFSRLIDVSTTTQTNREKLNTLARVTALSVVLILIASIVIGAFIARSISRPLKLLEEGAVAIGKGDLDTRIGMSRRDEIGVLSSAFDDMAHKLSMSRNELQRKQEELQRRRDELADVSRLATMGELATTIAHEINQPLTAILSSAGASRRLLAADEPDLEKLDEVQQLIVESATRAGEVIRHQRDFLHRGDLQKTPLAINELIRNIEHVIRAEVLRNKIVLLLDPAPDLPSLMGDPIQLEQVILNLIRNSLEAMEDPAWGNRELLVQTSMSGPHEILLRVRDTGPPIDDETIAQMFTPFHSTKPEGLGMGLAISRTIVEAHGGSLGATRNADLGITIDLTLACEEESSR